MLLLWHVNHFSSIGVLGEEKREKIMNKVQSKEDQNKKGMGTKDQLIKDMRTFSNWMWTGKVYLDDENPFVNKEYLLKLAGSLGAPLFRAAILKDPILSDSLYSEPSVFSHPLASSGPAGSDLARPNLARPNLSAHLDPSSNSESEAKTKKTMKAVAQEVGK